MKKSTSTRLIYNKDFYTLQAVMNSKKFVKLKKAFHKELARKGDPVPEKGFKTVSDYHTWTKIANEKLVGHYTLMKELLEEFGVEYTDEFRLGLAWHILFGHKKGPLLPLYKVGNTFSEDKKSVEVHLTVYPWTKKSDITENIWKHIEPALKELPDYVKKNREWETFERDFAVYQLFLKAQQDIKNGIRINQMEKSNSPYITITYYPEFDDIKQKYKTENLDDFVRSIISRCKKTFGEVNFL